MLFISQFCQAAVFQNYLKALLRNNFCGSCPPIASALLTNIIIAVHSNGCTRLERSCHRIPHTCHKIADRSRRNNFAVYKYHVRIFCKIVDIIVFVSVIIDYCHCTCRRIRRSACRYDDKRRFHLCSYALSCINGLPAPDSYYNFRFCFACFYKRLINTLLCNLCMIAKTM